MDEEEVNVLSREDELDVLLHEEVIEHKEDRTLLFVSKEEDLGDAEEFCEGPRVDVMVEIPSFHVQVRRSNETPVTESELSPDMLEDVPLDESESTFDPQGDFPSNGNSSHRRWFWWVFWILACLIYVSWFVWYTPAQDTQVPLIDEPPQDILPLEWWEDSQWCQGKIAQWVIFDSTIPSFLIETPEEHFCVCGILPIDPFDEQPMLIDLEGRKFYGCVPKEVFDMF